MIAQACGANRSRRERARAWHNNDRKSPAAKRTKNREMHCGCMISAHTQQDITALKSTVQSAHRMHNTMPPTVKRAIFASKKAAQKNASHADAAAETGLTTVGTDGTSCLLTVARNLSLCAASTQIL